MITPIKFETILLACIFLSFCSCCQTKDKSGDPVQDLTRYVDPYIGSGGHGHVFVGANVPFGFVQLGPTQYSEGWDWCSGYHYSDSTIIGFGHQHLSGTGIGDLGDISLMPAIGPVTTSRGTLPDESTGIYSYFSHKQEVVKPGYYGVHLNRFGIDVELTATQRAGFHKYTFPESDDAKVIIDLEHGIGWDEPVVGHIIMENDTVISGYRRSTGWAKDQCVFFVAIFSKPIEDFRSFDGTTPLKVKTLTTKKAYGEALFHTHKGEKIYVKVGLSAVSIGNARLNLQTELPGWNFEQAVADAKNAWNRQLNKVTVESNDTVSKKIFYTALYHTMIAPSVFNDVNGDYRGSDRKIHNDTSFTNYTTFSLWDTYRAAQPLMSLIHPRMTRSIGKTMINIYRQQGKLPVWHLMGNETNCMVGNPGIPVLADIVLKNFDIDKQSAFVAMKTSAMLNERGMKWLKSYGYLPYDKDTTYETVAKGLEYALADWCVAEVAKKINKKDDFDYFSKRSKSYRYYFDKNTCFMRGASSVETFREPFNPLHSSHRKDDYCEGNAWQYTWLVPHDVNGLINLFGDRNRFIAKLDSFFVTKGSMGDEASSDISGLIGQYAHGNEPSHHIAYLYSYAGQQWKTAKRVHQILTTLYNDTPNGLSGNEDVGQMSAWYVMSAMGLYQVAPAGGVYVFGSPLMNKVTIDVGNRKTFSIIARNNSPKNIYIQSAKLNGKPWPNWYINYSDIVCGGTLEFTMGSEPDKNLWNKR